MNVYDFDNTIYDGDSSVDLFFYTLKKYPKTYLKVPHIIFSFLKYFLKISSKTQAKQSFYQAILQAGDFDSLSKDFWDAHEKKIKTWYLKQAEEDDLIISASPDFDLEEIMNRLGIKNWIASKVDRQTGLATDANNDGKMKVVRFQEKYPQGKIDKFYSDSRHDVYLAKLAKEAYYVKGSKIEPW